MDPEPRAAPGREIDNDLGPFLCKICSKEFTKRPSRNRHVLYCKKKLRPNHSLLRKSCAACRKAKAKCNSEFPSCRRCVEKNLDCVYEITRRSEKSGRQLASGRPSSDDISLVASSGQENQNEVSWNIIREYEQNAIITSEVDCYDTLPTTGLDFTLQHDTSLDWEPDSGFVREMELSSLVRDSDFDRSSKDQSSFDWLLSGPPPSLTFDSGFSVPADCMFHTPFLVLRPMEKYSGPSSSSSSSSLVAPRSPFTHTYLSPRSQIGRTFLLQNIQACATMLSTFTLPPFIHNTSFPLSNPNLPPIHGPSQLESLAICQSIVKLYTTKTNSTSAFIWRTIKMERDRMMTEFSGSDEETVVAMLQAITIYILLRIFDQDAFGVDFDRELVGAMTEIAIRSELAGFLCSAEVEGRRPEWREWVLMESKRRTATLLFILHLLFDIKPEQRAKSKVGLSVLPLPAHRVLWAASTEEEWREAYDELLKSRDGRRYLNYGDLIALGNGGGVAGERMKDLNAWMVSGDAFGILVMMAATTL